MRRLITLVILVIVVLSLQSCSLRNNLTETPVPTEAQTITVHFTDEAKFNVGTEPYEVAVNRPLPAGVDPVRAVLNAFFAGPTAEETALGLVLVSSGFTGVGELTIEDGIARIHMVGKCANNGAAYSVANLIHKNLEQFQQISAIKIYDENGDNLDPDSDMSSMPYCLEP
ncbi:MAG: hypothetical protein CVU43_20615 [Chloroflexi bacterium HGW-Chloroflexi-5]|jgi:hypothetical protein|nr:MAG: hypothetical protein CVU43_20615 [Chloroflexi bacterium HGW-Chloroflexi-5]